MNLEEFSADKVNTGAIASQEDQFSAKNTAWHNYIKGAEEISDFGSLHIKNKFDSIGSFKRANQGTAENNFAAFLTQY